MWLSTSSRWAFCAAPSIHLQKAGQSHHCEDILLLALRRHLPCRTASDRASALLTNANHPLAPSLLTSKLLHHIAVIQMKSNKMLINEQQRYEYDYYHHVSCNRDQFWTVGLHWPSNIRWNICLQIGDWLVLPTITVEVLSLPQNYNRSHNRYYKWGKDS